MAGETAVPEGKTEGHWVSGGVCFLDAGKESPWSGELSGQIQLAMGMAGVLINNVELHFIATAEAQQ